MIDEEEDEGSGGAEGAPAWMATFSDLCTLLLTFFVLLLSFANMDVKHFRVAMGSVKEAMGVDVTFSGDFEVRATTPIEMSDTQGSDKITIIDLKKMMEEAVRHVKREVERRGLEDQVEVLGTQRGVVVRAKDNVLFDPGSAVIEGRGHETLGLISGLMDDFRGDLEIQGHTDNVPVRGRYRSNWELSAARATSVLRYLTEEHRLDEARLHVAGYADTRPVATMATDAGRTLNRRVEFVFEYPLEPTEQKKPLFKGANDDDATPE